MTFAVMALPGAPLRSQTAQTAQPGPPAAAPALAARINLNITPKRLVFDRTTRSATVYVFNQGNRPATADVTIVDRVMLPTGEIKPFTDAGAQADLKPVADQLRSARPFVIATPRRITLPPGKGQTIRLRVNLPADAEAAEYRSHLTVATVPPREAGLTAENAAAQAAGQLSIRIDAVFGLSIPLIVRTGPADIRGDIRNVRLAQQTISLDGVTPPRPVPVLTFDLERLGANSLFGNIEVRASAGRKDVLGTIRGVGVYTEIGGRTVNLPLQRMPAAGETLDLSFTDDDSMRGQIVARRSFTPN
jgi:hypothetical protein